MPHDVNEPLSITLTAGEWNQVIDTITDGRYRVVAPLIEKIIKQAQQSANTGDSRAIEARAAQFAGARHDHS